MQREGAVDICGSFVIYGGVQLLVFSSCFQISRYPRAFMLLH